MWVYDEISWCGVTAEAFARELDTITAPFITLRLNSPGGDVFDGVAIHNSLRQHPAAVNVVVDGLAASIASVIAMAGDTITMGPGTEMMIHDGMALCIGNASDMTQTAATLNKISDDIAGFYARRAGGSIGDWRAVMRAETWYSAEEAVTAGLANTADVAEADEAAEVEASPAARFDLSIFAYAGRSAAPGPPQVAPSRARVDVGAFRRQVRAARWPATAYADVIRDSIRRAGQ